MGCTWCCCWPAVPWPCWPWMRRCYTMSGAIQAVICCFARSVPPAVTSGTQSSATRVPAAFNGNNAQFYATCNAATHLQLHICCPRKLGSSYKFKLSSELADCDLNCKIVRSPATAHCQFSFIQRWWLEAGACVLHPSLKPSGPRRCVDVRATVQCGWVSTFFCLGINMQLGDKNSRPIAAKLVGASVCS